MENGFLKEAEAEDQRMYRVSSWWVNHREQIKHIGYGCFAAFDAVLIIFSVWTFVDGFVVSYGRERLAVAEMVAYGQADLNSRSRAEAAQPLVPGDAAVFAGDGGVVDIYVPLTNPNTGWVATFTYLFRSDTVETKPVAGFILPNEIKPITVFASKELGGARTAELVLSDVVWRRVDPHVTGDYAKWSTDRLNLAITDPLFQTDVKLGTTTVGRVSFTVTNKTAFSYYNPGFIILLKRGEIVVGVSRTTLDTLDSGETREVIVNWFGALPAAGAVEIIPEINIFDVNAYKPLGGETTTDTRNRVFVR